MLRPCASPPSILPRLITALLVVVLVLGAGVLSGCRPPALPPEPQPQPAPPDPAISRADQVRAGLADGLLIWAINTAKGSQPDEKTEVALALVDWADEVNHSAMPHAAAWAYVAALELDPLLTHVYQSLARLLDSHPHVDQNRDMSKQAYRAWQTWQGSDPGAGMDDTTTQAVAALALRSGDAATAARLDPALVVAQFLAAQDALREGEMTDAAFFAEQAAAALGDRADVLALLAAAGLQRPVEVSLVADVQLAEPVKYGRIVGWSNAAGDTLYLANPYGNLSAVRVPDGQVTTVAADFGGAAAQSPDRRQLAFGSEAGFGEPAEVRALDLVTGETTVIAETLAPILALEWSPDGASLAVSAHDGLFVVSMEGGGSGKVVVPSVLPNPDSSEPGDWHYRFALVRGWTGDGRGLMYQRVVREAAEILSSCGQWVEGAWYHDLGWVLRLT